ncbi:MAG TPA: apolipoprotein N-acyltransferase [Burkholderiaceae bacterium]|nr:apolipoprotein N-acyltransferase [Burkholderiaceae bacterium]
MLPRRTQPVVAERRWPAWADVMLVAVLGALQTVPFVWTGWWPLQLLCVAALAYRVLAASVWRAALLGLVFGTAWLCAGVWWLFISMHRYGHLPAWMAALAVLALALALSAYLSLAMAAVARWRSGHAWHDAVCFAAAWLLAELARTWLFTGFPWLASGYAQVDSPLAVLAPWVGVLGIGAVVAATAALWSRALTQPLPTAVTAIALALAAWAGPSSHSQPGATLSVSLLQTNVPQDEKFMIEQLPQTLRSLAADVASARGQLVIAPETAVPLLPSQLEEMSPGYMAALAERFRTAERAALIGVALGDYDRGYSNSVLGLVGTTAASAPYRYDKQHLVPFGEFIPTGFRWFTTLLNIPLGDFVRGARNPPSFSFAGERIAPNICYEDLYGDELALRFADEASAPTVFANLSNIGWFGDTVAVDQHLNISRMRTLELQRPMLRATNTGATAVIDHRGRVIAALEPFTRGVLEAQVQGRNGVTPYAWWAPRAGLWPYLALGLIGCLACALRQRAAGRTAIA